MSPYVSDLLEKFKKNGVRSDLLEEALLEHNLLQVTHWTVEKQSPTIVKIFYDGCYPLDSGDKAAFQLPVKKAAIKQGKKWQDYNIKNFYIRNFVGKKSKIESHSDGQIIIKINWSPSKKQGYILEFMYA